jgi:hypothetical protein
MKIKKGLFSSSLEISIDELDKLLHTDLAAYGPIQDMVKGIAIYISLLKHKK